MYTVFKLCANKYTHDPSINESYVYSSSIQTNRYINPCKQACPLKSPNLNHWISYSNKIKWLQYHSRRWTSSHQQNQNVGIYRHRWIHCHDPGPSYDNLGPWTILTPVNSELTEVQTEFTKDNIQSIHTCQLYNLRKYTLTINSKMYMYTK